MALPYAAPADIFTRMDELLVLLLKVEEEQLRLLAKMAAQVMPVVTVEKIIRRYDKGVAIEEIAKEYHTTETIVREIIEREVAVPAEVRVGVVAPTPTVLALPTRLKKMEFDTSITEWKSLRDEKKLKSPPGWIRPEYWYALGFWVEDIGGGFEYQIARISKGFVSEGKVAEMDDKWDIEFDDILVKGAGEGTGVIWYWWRE